MKSKDHSYVVNKFILLLTNLLRHVDFYLIFNVDSQKPENVGIHEEATTGKAKERKKAVPEPTKTNKVNRDIEEHNKVT